MKARTHEHRARSLTRQSLTRDETPALQRNSWWLQLSDKHRDSPLLIAFTVLFCFFFFFFFCLITIYALLPSIEYLRCSSRPPTSALQDFLPNHLLGG